METNKQLFAVILVKQPKGGRWERFDVPLAVAYGSGTLANLIEDVGDDTIPLPEIITPDVFDQILKYLCIHSAEQANYIYKCNTLSDEAYPDCEAPVGTDENYKQTTRVPHPARKIPEGMDWLFKQTCEGGSKDAYEEFDANLMKKSVDELIDIMIQANYLDIPLLIDLIAQGIAAQIKGKSVNQLRALFHVPFDEVNGVYITGWTPEQEEAVRKELAWMTN